MPVPTVEGEKRTRGKGRRKPARSLVRRWLRRILLLFVAVVLLPLLLTLAYRPPVLHPISTLMLADFLMLKGYDRRWVPLDEMSPAIAYSVTMSEDGQFCSHWGVDWGAVNLVISDALSGEKPRGASTIPMQTVKNLFLWPGRSYLRKAAEVPLALYFSWIVPKARIMEIYLNIAEWGPGIYGAEAAAQHHFGRSARDLSARQAALLAATLPNPLGREPARPSAGLNRLASVIEARARKAGGYVDCLGIG